MERWVSIGLLVKKEKKGKKKGKDNLDVLMDEWMLQRAIV